MTGVGATPFGSFMETDSTDNVDSYTYGLVPCVKASAETDIPPVFSAFVSAKKIWSNVANDLLILSKEKHNSRLPGSFFNVVSIKFVLAA
jgi:hypothetical protein